MVFDSGAVNFVALGDECSSDADGEVPPACNQSNFFGGELRQIEILGDSSHGVVLKAK